MSLTDRTNEDIPLSLHSGPLGEVDGKISIDVDQDSSFDPSSWLWIMFYALPPREDGDPEPWFKLTFEEAEMVYDRLGRCLGKEPA